MNAALIGLGRAAWLYAEDRPELDLITHTHSILNDSTLRLVAGFDKNEKSSASWEAKFGIPTFRSFSDLPADLDLVIIAVNHESLCDTFFSSLTKWPSAKILVEKPLVTNEHELKRILGLSPADTMRTYINFPRLFQKETQEVKNFIEEYLDRNPYEKLSLNGTYSGGYLNTASHFLSLERFLFGRLEYSINSDSIPSGLSYNFTNHKLVGTMIGSEIGPSTANFRISGKHLTIDYLDGGKMIKVDDDKHGPIEVITSRDSYQQQVYNGLKRDWLTNSDTIASLKSQMETLETLIRIQNEWEQF